MGCSCCQQYYYYIIIYSLVHLGGKLAEYAAAALPGRWAAAEFTTGFTTGLLQGLV